MFTKALPLRDHLLHQIDASSRSVAGMKNNIFRDVRGLLLAVLVVAVAASGPLHGPISNGSPNTPGLGRLGRDLLRRVVGEASERSTEEYRMARLRTRFES
jgi:hypothetical protein